MIDCELWRLRELLATQLKFLSHICDLFLLCFDSQMQILHLHQISDRTYRLLYFSTWDSNLLHDFCFLIPQHGLKCFCSWILRPVFPRCVLLDNFILFSWNYIHINWRLHIIMDPLKMVTWDPFLFHTMKLHWWKSSFTNKIPHCKLMARSIIITTNIILNITNNNNDFM